MIYTRWKLEGASIKWFMLLMLLITSSIVQAATVTLNVVDSSGIGVEGFRYILQEDTTFPVDPASPATTPDELLSMSFHASNHPPARSETGGTGLSGNSGTASAAIADVAAGRYYVSVLPYAGYSISGAQVVAGVDDLAVTVVVQKQPIPTTQISIFLFHDNHPINGNPDLPEELDPGLGEDGLPLPGHVDWTQFTLFLEEPAGRYGIAGGQVIQDAFGNPLGTTYVKGCDADGNVEVPDDPFTDYGCLNPDGSPQILVEGDGVLHPDENGFLTVKNIPPAKYGVIMIPPSNQGWQQTSTIEGSKVIDAWVKANEPPFFVEFGLPGPHVFVGFLKSTTDGGFDSPIPGGGVTAVSGTVTDMHMSRSPQFQFFSGRPFPQCWVGLNESTLGGLGQGLYAEPCDGASGFSIPNVPAGSYQLAIWDANLDVVFAALPFTVDAAGTCNGGGSCNFGDVPVFNWFARLNTGVFNDDDQDGFWDPNEIGIGPDTQDVSLRWRDGSIYQNFPTDNGGLAPFDEVFPFFHWLVAEVSFASKKATGATFVIDAGGEIPADNGWIMPSFDELTPQGQFCTPAQSSDIEDPNFNCVVGTPLINPNTITPANPAGNNFSRTETGQVLTTAFQAFLGQTSVMQFGKTDYVTFTDFDFTDPVNPILPEFVGENGGISGIVFYATTRAEDDPQFAAAEEWEPGVPRVQIALYADGDIDCFPTGDFPLSDCDIDWNGNGTLEADDGSIDDANQNGIPGELADVDNYPLGNFPGPEDVDHTDHGTIGVFDYGDALAVTWTDSWDDSLPTGCQGDNLLDFDGDNAITPEENSRCIDGLRNFNQIRPGVFDGGYAFNNYDTAMLQAAIQTKLAAFYANRIALVGTTTAGIRVLPDEWILPSDYIVEAATPAGLKLMREHHKNVDYGDSYIPSAQAIAASCVGDMQLVPEFLAMATKDGSGNDAALIPGVEAILAPYSLTDRPLCDRKKLSLSSAQNAPVDFFLMSDVPLMANVSGVILNDLGNEFDPNSPAFGEKFAPPQVPVAFYDWNGNLVSRVYGDTFGRYNAVVPSTYTANLPMPSGMSPNMLVSCMNDAGPIDDGNGNLVIDPFFNPQFSQFCYTFQYMPAVITYLDTPVEPIAAFAGTANGLDCERPTQTPMIDTVSRDVGLGGPFALLGDTVTITSLGLTTVLNPDWDGIDLALKNITRDYSFGGVDENRAYLENADGILIRIKIASEGPASIVASLVKQNNNAPGDLVPGEYQVVVENTAVGQFTPMGVTLTLGTINALGVEVGIDANGNEFNVVSVPTDYPSIQAAIGDLSNNLGGVAPGDLILVAPGIYNETVIMWKPVKLQGWGASSVLLNARQSPTEGLADWRRLTSVLVSGGFIDTLPGQVLAPLGFPALAEALFPSEEGAGIFVAGVEETGDNGNSFVDHPGARIDGLTVIGASQGGGIVLNGYNAMMNVSNNRVTSNSGIFGGGIRVGHHNISHETDGDLGLIYDDAQNDMVRIHHNHVAQNGNTNGTGGGLSLHTGADDYKVQKNWLCGNFSKGNGGGMAHFGLSDNGLIEDNQIIFNEVFNQMPGTAPSGAGVFIGGQPALQLDVNTGLMLSPGSGSVVIDANIVRGNLAGAGDGAGIAVKSANGVDVAASLDDNANWYQVGLYNNMVNNNVAGVAGAVTLSDALMVDIRHNSVANNDSTATGSQAFLPGVPNMSVPQPAGVVSRLHSPVMSDLISLVEVAVNPDFSDPLFMANIVFQNRSFYWLNSTPDAAQGVVTMTGIYPAFCDPATIDPANPATCDVTDVESYTWDMAVMNGVISADPLNLNPLYSLLTANVGNPGEGDLATTNIYEVTLPGLDLLSPLDAVFENSYFNVPRDNLIQNEFKTLQTAAAFDEGGNFIQVAYAPLSLVDTHDDPTGLTLFDYHLTGGSPAIDELGEIFGPVTLYLDLDIDNELRDKKIDIGADER